MPQRSRGKRTSLILKDLCHVTAAVAVYQVQAVNRQREELNEQREEAQALAFEQGQQYPLVALPRVSMNDYLHDLIAYTLGLRKYVVQLMPDELPNRLEQVTIDTLASARPATAPPLGTKLPPEINNGVHKLMHRFDVIKQEVGCDLVTIALRMPEYVVSLTQYVERATEVLTSVQKNTESPLVTLDTLTPQTLLRLGGAA